METARAERGDWAGAPLFFRKFPNFVLHWLFTIVWRLRVTGLEHVPASGAVIAAGNHVANLDGPLVAVALGGLRNAKPLAKIELYSVPVLGWFLRKTGTVPVDRRGDVGAMRAAAAILESGGALIMMPEGTRSKDGKPGKPRAGVGFLAGLTKASVVPVHLIGTDRWPFVSRLEVRFGAPMRHEGDPNDREEALAFAQRVMDRVFSL